MNTETQVEPNKKAAETPTDGPLAEGVQPQPAADPEPTLDMKEQALVERETALAQRERRFLAREHLMAMGLPEEILQHVDCGSDAAMEQALTIAALSARAAAQVPALPVPASSRPPAPAFASYVDRARLFLEDPEAYRLMRGQ